MSGRTLDAKRGLRLTVAECAARLPTPEGRWFIAAFRRAELEVELYSPQRHDPQQPHTRDELYVVIEGRGEFVMADERVPFGPGDLLFVPAGVAHRFESFGESLRTWVIFYGPHGGGRASGTVAF